MLVFRAVTGQLEGPFVFLSIDGENSVVQTARGRRIFRSVCVKTVTPAKLADDQATGVPRNTYGGTDEESVGSDAHKNYDEAMLVGRVNGRTKAEKNNNLRVLTEARREGIEGLLNEGTFEK